MNTEKKKERPMKARCRTQKCRVHMPQSQSQRYKVGVDATVFVVFGV